MGHGKQILLEQKLNVRELAASFSHEMRNPIAVARGFIQLLKDTSLSLEQKEFYIYMSLMELDRVDHIISNFLTFANAVMEVEEILDLNHEVEQAIKAASLLTTRKGIQIYFQKREHQVHIIGESNKLQQCIMNLLQNSIEAIEHTGSIHIQLMKSKEHAKIIIQDTGKGMNAEQINRLGTPFYCTKGKGTGLGTMVAFRIIELMNGSVRVESVQYEGTSMTISFPLAF